MDDSERTSYFELAEAWVRYQRQQLTRRYGLGTFVAVYDNAVIDWGQDEESVRQRAEKAIGEPVYVGAVPGDPYPDYWDNYDNYQVEYQQYKAIAEKIKYRRRFSFQGDTLHASDELDITGTKREMAHGYVIIDGVERRFAYLDYRMLVEHGAIPKETELIGGVVFWKEPGERECDL